MTVSALEIRQNQFSANQIFHKRCAAVCDPGRRQIKSDPNFSVLDGAGGKNISLKMLRVIQPQDISS